MNELITTIQKVLSDADLVLGWTLNKALGVAEPGRFYDTGDAEAAVFNSTCVHNLAVYLPRLKDKTIGIVAKGCDCRSIAQLIIEGEITREQVRVIGVPCRGILDIKKVWQRFGYGTRIDEDRSSLVIGGEATERNSFLMPKCSGCRDIRPVLFDETVGEIDAAVPPGAAPPAEIKQRFAEMTPALRADFWRRQFSRCIRCYACREACPLCFCRDVCTMQSSDPHWAGSEVNAGESQMAQHIRISHLAGRCTGCGECERACPVGIPLMLLLDEQNRAIEEMFGYRAGTSLGARPPLLTFDSERDSWSGNGTGGNGR